LIKSLGNLEHAHLGFDSRGLITFQVALPTEKYPINAQAPQFFRALLDSIWAKTQDWNALLQSALADFLEPHFKTTKRRELIVDAPMGTEFYGACRRVTPDIYERRRKIQLKYTQAVLGTKEVSEVFMLAVDGLTHDLPATKVLRMRLEVLIDRFVRD
jgi:hypothetical protein